MAPTIHQNHASSENKRPPRGERRSDLVCKIKYCNTLPDIPFDTKFINYPFSANRYVQYKPTSLEKNYKHEVLAELDLGVSIDLINTDTYATVPGAELHPDDEKLLEDDVLMPQDAKRSRHHHVNVSWLRRTEYISTETTRYQPQTMEKIEATVGFASRRKSKRYEETIYTDRESQLIAIEKTFEQVKNKEKVHYSKPGVTAVEEFPIFPDFDMWKHPCAQVIFDSDPAPVGRSVPAQLEEMSQAMIRGVMDESGEQFVAYFLPSEDTLEKRAKDREMQIEYTDSEEYDYLLAREYNWNVKNKASKGYEENYFLVMRDDGVYYNELETRVRLSKRRVKQGHQPNNSRLVVSHRPLNEIEFKMQRQREKMLEPTYEEEEEEEIAELADNEGGDEESVNSGAESDSGGDSAKNSDGESDSGGGSDKGSGDDSGKDSGDDSDKGSGDDSGKDSGDDSGKDSGDESGKDSANDSGDDSAKGSDDVERIEADEQDSLDDD